MTRLAVRVETLFDNRQVTKDGHNGLPIAVYACDGADAKPTAALPPAFVELLAFKYID